MTDRYSITPEGEKIVEEITRLYASGYSIEEVAEFFDIEVSAIRVLMALDALTGSQNG